MADEAASDLTEGTVLEAGDLHIITDVSDLTDDPAGTTKRFAQSVLSAMTETLTNKTINRSSNTITVSEADISDLQAYLLAADIDTLAELNAILTDATLDTSSATRTPSAHDQDASTITSGTLPPARLGAASIDAITEIAAALKTGSDPKLVTGTAGTATNMAVWGVNGDIIDGGAPGSGGSGDLVKLETVDLSTLTSADVDGVVGFDDTTYDWYEIWFHNVVPEATDEVTINFLNGATLINAASYLSDVSAGISGNTTYQSDDLVNGTYIRLTASAVVNEGSVPSADSTGLNGCIVIPRMITSTHLSCYWDLMHMDNGAKAHRIKGAAIYYVDAQAGDGVRIQCLTQDFNRGTVTVYGRK
jgi:hypothetical protein